MIYFKNNKYHISTQLINYTHKGETTEKYIGSEGLDWWKDFETRWDDMVINEVKNTQPTSPEKDRLEVVNIYEIPQGFSKEVRDYVAEGKFPDRENHVLQEIENREMINVLIGGGDIE